MKWRLSTKILLGIGLAGGQPGAQADDQPSALQSAVGGTTLGGYVEASAHWNPGSGDQNLPYYGPNGTAEAAKANGINLDGVELTIAKPAGGGHWSAGYSATLLLGPEAVAYNTSFVGPTRAATGDFGLKDTFVDFQVPLGNGCELKLGTFSSPLGYEVYEAGANPNYTRSYGYEMEPTALTGLLAVYQLCPAVLVNAGVANTWSAGIDSRASASVPAARADSFKTYLGNLTFVAPTNWGVVSGSTLSGGVLNGWDALSEVDRTTFYAGTTFNTPFPSLKTGLAFDYARLGDNAISGHHEDSGYQTATGIYLNWQALPALSFNARGEYFSQSGYLAAPGLPRTAVELAETAQYDVWKNVVSRVELRWDHDASGGDSFTTHHRDNTVLVALDIIHRF